jgi:hypothetical protein
MRVSTAYFAGAGTVVAAIAIGLGGGLTIANIINPHPDKGMEVTKLERRMSDAPKPAADLSATLVPVPYLATTLPGEAAPAPTAAPAEPRTEAANPVPAPRPAAEQPAVTASAKPQDPPTPSLSAVPSAARERAAKPEDAMAKARDADLKRVERNRSERRQQWADRRRHETRQSAQPRAQEPLEVEQTVREDIEPDESPAAPRIEFPLIRLFSSE